jgi:ferritin-like metal-binding protein YciE
MKKNPYIKKQMHELLYQALETERGGIKIYETALLCAQNKDLKSEWEEYLEQTRTHEQVLLQVFEALGLNPETVTPGREVVAHIGDSLVAAMKMAKARGSAAAAQLVAGECVVLAETKDHLNWELIGHLAEHGQGEETGTLRTAFEAVEQEEDHHLYHTKGFTRELWIDSLGLPAVLPPPEEVKAVETAIGAARAENQRGDMLKSKH